MSNGQYVPKLDYTLRARALTGERSGSRVGADEALFKSVFKVELEHALGHHAAQQEYFASAHRSSKKKKHNNQAAFYREFAPSFRAAQTTR